MSEFNNIIETWETKFRGKHSTEDEVNKYKCLNAFLQAQVKPKDIFADEELEVEEESEKKFQSEEISSSSINEFRDSASKTRQRNSLILRDLDSFRNNSLCQSSKRVHEPMKRFSLKTDFDLIQMEETSEEEDNSNNRAMPSIPEEFTTATPKSHSEKCPNSKGEFLFIVFKSHGNARKRRISNAFDLGNLAKGNLTDFAGSIAHRNCEIESSFRKGSENEISPFFLVSSHSFENNRISLDAHNRIFIEEGSNLFKENNISLLLGLSGSGVFLAHPKSQSAYNFFLRKSICNVGFTKKAPKFFQSCLKLELNAGKLLATDTNSIKGVFVKVPHKTPLIAESDTLVKLSRHHYISFEFLKSSVEMHHSDEIFCLNGDEPQEMIKSFLTVSPVSTFHKAKRSLFHEKAKFLEKKIGKYPMIKVNLIKFDTICNRFVQRRALILYYNLKASEMNSNKGNFSKLEEFPAFNFLNSKKLKLRVGFQSSQNFWFYYSSVIKDGRTKIIGKEDSKPSVRQFSEYRKLSAFSNNPSDPISKEFFSFNPSEYFRIVSSLNFMNSCSVKPLTNMHEIQEITSKPEESSHIGVSIGEFSLFNGKFGQRTVEIGLDASIEIDNYETKVNYAILNKLSN